jgi:hypothetical protein
MNRPTRRAGQDEVDAYLDQRPKLPGTVAHSERISWWKTRKDRLPALYEVAMAVGVVQATSSAPERQFSKAKRQLTKFRLRIGPETLDAAITCGENIDISGEALQIDASLMKLLHDKRKSTKRVQLCV